MHPVYARAAALALVVVTSACLPPTKTGKICQTHEDCEHDALWKPIEESVGQDYLCLKGPNDEEGLCVRGTPPEAIDAGTSTDAGGIDAGDAEDAGPEPDAGPPPVDAGFGEDAGGDPPELEVVVSECANSVDVDGARTSGLVVATRGGAVVEPRLTDVGLAGLGGLCVVDPGIGSFRTHLGRLRFTPGEAAFDGLVTFAGLSGVNARRVHFVVVEPSDMKTWSPTATSDDVLDAQNWIPAGPPQPTDLVYVPRSSSVPRFGAVASYAQTLVVETGADTLLTGALGFGKGALVGGRTNTDQNGRVVLQGALLTVDEFARTGGLLSALELRQSARARVVAPLVVERQALVASTTADLRPELLIDEPVELRVGGELAVGSAGIFAGSGRLTVDHPLATVRVFGAIELRSLAENPSRFRSGAIEAWDDVTCIDGAADFEEGFDLVLPGDQATPIETEVMVACALADVVVAANRVTLFSAIDASPAVVIDDLRVAGVALAASDLEVETCCLPSNGVLATTGTAALRVGGVLVIEGSACVSGSADGMHPLVEGVACTVVPECASTCDP